MTVSCLMLNGSMVQWFSGMLFCCAGFAIYSSKLFGVKEKQEEESTGMRKVGRGRLDLELGIKGGKLSRD